MHTRSVLLSLIKVKTIILLFSLSLLFSSCEKIIDLNLNDAEKKYVVEAGLTDQPGSAKVMITQTKNFDEDNNFIGISGAAVQIAESGGATTSLIEISPGVYEAPGLAGVAGKTYNLSITVNGNNFNAICTMPLKVNLDTIFVTDEFLFTETRKIANVEYLDPAGRGNSYRFIQYVNGLKEDHLMIENDDYTDGRNINDKLFYFSDEEEHKIKTGDTLRIDMLCIDPAIYQYWFSLDRSSTGQSGQATPSNPVTNMKGGALGYFSAHTFQTKTMIVP
ncbi:MAG TPA: DUF4249 domain-containing protein [Chitinophagaceae bacterium]|nr:DUF4249 domain-containing protein [Chitinophagaceae bacterium]